MLPASFGCSNTELAIIVFVVVAFVVVVFVVFVVIVFVVVVFVVKQFPQPRVCSLPVLAAVSHPACPHYRQRQELRKSQQNLVSDLSSHQHPTTTH